MDRPPYTPGAEPLESLDLQDSVRSGLQFQLTFHQPVLVLGVWWTVQAGWPGGGGGGGGREKRGRGGGGKGVEDCGVPGVGGGP